MVDLRVFLVDEHEVVRRGVAAILGEQDDIKIVGEAATGASALVRVKALKPAVTIMALTYGDMDGVQLCRELRDAQTGMACLCLTGVTDDQVLMQAFLAGAAGVINKSIRADELVDAVRAVAGGRSLLDARAVGAILERLKQGPRPRPFSALTPMEHQILELLGEGLTNKEIGDRTFLAEKSVKNYVSRVLAKLKVSSRTQAALAYREESA